MALRHDDQIGRAAHIFRQRKRNRVSSARDPAGPVDARDAEIRTQIERFDANCAAEEYTDCCDHWELTHWIYEQLDGRRSDLHD